MKHLGLFEGIGGFSLAARWMGWETVAWCEWNEFCQRVLRHHFPEAIGHGDITQTDFTSYANKIDILTGGFPCQPYSAAGKRRGKEDDRHLWPQMCRAIREIAPRYVVGENVLGLVNWNGGMVFDEVCADLELEGYEVTPVVIPAAAVNAPHGRDRVWFVAHSINNRHSANKREIREKDKIPGINWQEVGSRKLDGTSVSRPTPDTDQSGREERHDIGEPAHTKTDGARVDDRTERLGNDGPTPDTDSTSSQCRNGKASQGWENAGGRIESFSQHTRWEKFPTQSPICGGDDGLSRELDGITFPKWRAESIKAYGNAIVPQVALTIFRAIEAMSFQQDQG